MSTDIKDYEVNVLYDDTSSATSFSITVGLPNELIEGETYISNESKRITVLPSESHVLVKDGKILLHREDGPASTIHGGEGTTYRFALYGIHVSIDQLPVDDEMKCILALKYQPHCGMSRVYV